MDNLALKFYLCTCMISIVGFAENISAQEQSEIAIKKRLNEAYDRQFVAEEKKNSGTREGEIAYLVWVITEEEVHLNSKEDVEQALTDLGNLRAHEAIDTLIHNIGFPFAPDSMNGRKPRIMTVSRARRSRRHKAPKIKYPAVGALIKIGEPAMVPVIERLVKAKHFSNIEACRGVLRELQNKYPVRKQLETNLKNLKGSQHKNVQEAIKALDKKLSISEENHLIDKKNHEKYGKQRVEIYFRSMEDEKFHEALRNALDKEGKEILKQAMKGKSGGRAWSNAYTSPEIQNALKRSTESLRKAIDMATWQARKREEDMINKAIMEKITSGKKK